MRMLFYNIRYGTGYGWGYHLPFPFAGFFRSTEKGTERIGALLDDLDVDVACLCEVDGGSYRQKGKSQARSLAPSHRWSHAFAPKYGTSPLSRLPLLSTQGNAVLSRIPFMSSTENLFSRGMKRSLLEVEFPNFVILLTHLSLGRSARQSQLEELALRCRSLEKPLIVGGDFNILRGSEELRPLMAATGLSDADASGRPTFPSRRPTRRLDCLLTTPGVRVRTFDLPAVELSDHLPLLCDIDIDSEGDRP